MEIYHEEEGFDTEFNQSVEEISEKVEEPQTNSGSGSKPEKEIVENNGNKSQGEGEVEIISVRFKVGGRQYFFDPQGESLSVGEGVIVETARGNEFGEIVKGNFNIEERKITLPLRKLLRRASEKDHQLVEKNRQRESWAKKVCLEKIALHKLDMKLVEVEYSFEGNKVLFFFTSDGRVDFRGLVRDLAATIHARIELRQIGVRDEAKMVGGLGICGRPFCCKQFLDKFQPVSIKMAKTQNLSLNPTKISGTCGRLMCCLKYEQDAYEDLLKTTPRGDSFVETPDGAGTITTVNLLRQQVAVRLESDPTVAKKYHNSEIVVVRSGKGKRPDGYVQPSLEKLEKQRRVVEAPVIHRSAGVNSLASNLESILNPTPPPTRPKGKTPEGKQRHTDNQGRGNQKNRSNYKGKRPNKPQHDGKTEQTNENMKNQGGKDQRPPQKKNNNNPAQGNKPNRPKKPSQGQKPPQGKNTNKPRGKQNPPKPPREQKENKENKPRD